MNNTEEKERILSILNKNIVQVSISKEDTSMGLGICEIRCLRTKNVPGKKLSKI